MGFYMALIAGLLFGRRPQGGAPWVRKFGNLAMREIWVVTSNYARPPYRLWWRKGVWGGVTRQPIIERKIKLK